MVGSETSLGSHGLTSQWLTVKKKSDDFVNDLIMPREDLSYCAHIKAFFIYVAHNISWRC